MEEYIFLKELYKLSSGNEEILRLFTYPHYNLSSAIDRVRILMNNGVEAIHINGPVKIGRIGIEGKGTNSIVFKVKYMGEDAILKILRMDSPRRNFNTEAEVLRKIDETCIGPKLYKYLEWAIILEYIRGEPLKDFLPRILNDEDRVIHILKDLFRKAIELDLRKIDHGELVRWGKHIVYDRVNKSVRFIDFESASMSRRPRNFTSVIQYLLYRFSEKDRILKLLKPNDLEEYRSLLREYKLKPDITILNKILPNKVNN